MNKKIALLLSGGVDSSVALHLLCASGEKPDCFYIHIGPDKDDTYSCISDEDIEMCKAITKRYDVNFDIIDLHKEYWDEVVKYTMDKVALGYTPNPDVMCNTLIKFGAFYDKIGYKYDFIATGHYATKTCFYNKNYNNIHLSDDDLEKHTEWYISPAKDPVKDQVDFIANINTKKIPIHKIIFPIGELTKEEVRKIAEDNHLINAKRKDSQGICFLGKINYNDYIKEYLGENEGNIVNADTGEVIGKHNGHWFHTIGQRKGLGLSGGPWFVVSKNPITNIVYVSNNQNNTEVTEFYVRDINWLTKDLINEWSHNTFDCNIKFKVRHTPEIYTGKIYWDNLFVDSIKIISDVPVTVASGQFCILYDEDYKVCYGCGEILSKELNI